MTNLNFNTFLLKKFVLDGQTFGDLTGGRSESFQAISAFDTATLDDLKNLDLAKLLLSENSLDALDENASADQKALAEMVKAFLSLDGVVAAADTDGSKDLDADEALAFLQKAMAFDGDLTNLTMEDLDQVIQSLNIDLEDVMDTAIEEALAVESAEELQNVNQANTASNGGGNYGNYNSYSNGSSANPVKTTAETIQELEQQIEAKEGEITAAEEEAEGLIQEQEEAKKQAMEQAGVSEQEYEAYQEQEQKLEDDIKAKDKEIDGHKAKISDCDASISSNNNYLESIEAEISNNNAAIDAVQGDDEDATAKKDEIQQKIKNLEGKRDSVKAEITRLEGEKEEEEKAIKLAESAKQQLEVQKQNLLTTTLDNSAGFGKTGGSKEALKAQIAQYDTNIADIRTQKNDKVESIRSDIQDLKVQLQDTKEKEERNSFLRENSFLSGDDILELAKEFEGKTQSEMREIMKNAGYQFDDGVWCADFVSFIAGQTIGEENLPDWYKNCNRAYCPDIMKNAKANGAFVGADQAQPGDAILFDWDGDGTADHIGYVVGFNDDGSVQTIEGNTSGSNSGSQVASKTRNKGNVLGYVKLT